MSTSVTSATTSAATASSSASLGSSKELGKDAFMKLLIEQLKNQDPTKPVDNTQMLAQLASFSSLEQMQSVSSKLDSLLLAQTSSNQLSTTGLVGKTVTYRGDGVSLVQGEASTTKATVASDAASVTAVVKDATGKVVRTLSLGGQVAGTFDVAWDGKDQSGAAAPSGSYTISLSATAAGGAPVPVEHRCTGKVQGVNFGADGSQLRIGGTLVKMSDVVEISQA